MTLRRLFQHCGILLYILVSAVALLYTLTRIKPPAVVWPAVRFSYGMMAPYQGYSTLNNELRAEGLLPSGAWEPIALKPYMPFLRAENSVRGLVPTVYVSKPQLRTWHYEQLAQQLVELEQKEGRSYKGIRFTMDYWPRSPEGYYAQRMHPFVESELLLTYQ